MSKRKCLQVTMMDYDSSLKIDFIKSVHKCFAKACSAEQTIISTLQCSISQLYSMQTKQQHENCKIEDLQAVLNAQARWPGNHFQHCKSLVNTKIRPLRNPVCNNTAATSFPSCSCLRVCSYSLFKQTATLRIYFLCIN